MLPTVLKTFVSFKRPTSFTRITNLACPAPFCFCRLNLCHACTEPNLLVSLLSSHCTLPGSLTSHPLPCSTLPAAAAAAAKSRQSCPTLCDPIDGGPPGSPVPGILQARTPERVAISFSNAWKGKVKVKSLSRVRLFATPWSEAYQAPLLSYLTKVFHLKHPCLIKANHPNVISHLTLHSHGFPSASQHFVVVQLLNCVTLFATPWTAVRQASLSGTISQSLLKLMSIELVMPSNHLILCHSFSSQHLHTRHIYV